MVGFFPHGDDREGLLSKGPRFKSSHKKIKTEGDSLCIIGSINIYSKYTFLLWVTSLWITSLGMTSVGMTSLWMFLILVFLKVKFVLSIIVAFITTEVDLITMMCFHVSLHVIFQTESLFAVFTLKFLATSAYVSF